MKAQELLDELKRRLNIQINANSQQIDLNNLRIPNDIFAKHPRD